MYKVLIAFCDGENGKPYHPKHGGASYAVGDAYPKGDFKPTEEHVKYLLSDKTKVGKPVIERIKPVKAGE